MTRSCSRGLEARNPGGIRGCMIAGHFPALAPTPPPTNRPLEVIREEAADAARRLLQAEVDAMEHEAARAHDGTRRASTLDSTERARIRRERSEALRVRAEREPQFQRAWTGRPRAHPMPVVGMVLPNGWMVFSEPVRYPKAPSNLMFGLKCPACGHIRGATVEHCAYRLQPCRHGAPVKRYRQPHWLPAK